MLVLQRSLGQRIRLKDTATGETIYISLEDIRPGRRATIGIQASSRIEIMREELLDASTGERKQAPVGSA